MANNVWFCLIAIPAAVDIIDLPPDAKEGEVTIKWNTPKDNGEAITQYTVYQRTVNDDGTTQPWIKIKEIKDLLNRVVVVILKKSKKYEFVVTATNGEGESLKEKDRMKTIAVGGQYYLIYCYYFLFENLLL